MAEDKKLFKVITQIVIPVVTAIVGIFAGGIYVNQTYTVNNVLVNGVEMKVKPDDLREMYSKLSNDYDVLLAAQQTVEPTTARLTAAPVQLPAQGPFDFPMPDVPEAGYFFVIDYYYPNASGTGYRIISYQRPADLDFTVIKGNWYLESNKTQQIASRRMDRLPACEKLPMNVLRDSCCNSANTPLA